MNYYKIVYFVLHLAILFSFAGCKDAMKALHDEIKSYGYIPYPTPLQFSGPGTLVGGSPKALNLIASPEACFPSSLDLVNIDYTSVPNKSYKVKVTGNAKFKLINFLKSGNPVLSAGVNFGRVKSMQMVMTGVSIEYIDSIKLANYYRNGNLDPICKEYLNYVAFIIQAMKVNELSIKFYDKRGGRIHFDVNNIESIVDIGADIIWDVEKESVLKIKTPKYIGYQLGRLISEDNGLVLYRASKVKRNKYFVFKPVSIFNTDQLENEAFFSFGQKSKSHIPFIVDKLFADDYIDEYSIYEE